MATNKQPADNQPREHYVQTAFQDDPTVTEFNKIDRSLTLDGYRYIQVSRKAFERIVNALDDDEKWHQVTSFTLRGAEGQPLPIRLLHARLIQMDHLRAPDSATVVSSGPVA